MLYCKNYKLRLNKHIHKYITDISVALPMTASKTILEALIDVFFV